MNLFPFQWSIFSQSDQEIDSESLFYPKGGRLVYNPLAYKVLWLLSEYLQSEPGEKPGFFVCMTCTSPIDNENRLQLAMQ